MKKARFLLFLALCVCGSGCANPAWNEYPEFAKFKSEARGRYMGVLGYSVSVPGCEDLGLRIKRDEVFVIPGTTDFIEGEEALLWNLRAHAFAKRYNEWLRKVDGR